MPSLYCFAALLRSTAAQQSGSVDNRHSGVSICLIVVAAVVTEKLLVLLLQPSVMIVQVLQLSLQQLALAVLPLLLLLSYTLLPSAQNSRVYSAMSRSHTLQSCALRTLVALTDEQRLCSGKQGLQPAERSSVAVTAV
jgi:hypothetical protein